MEQRHVEDVTVGEEIGPLTLVVDPVRMFAFSAATHNAHRIHYDHVWATEKEGYPDLVVHGPLQAALLARVVTDWMGGSGRLVRFAIQNRAAAFAGQELTFGGTVTGVRGNLVDLEIQGTRGEQVLVPGTATVQLPSRER